MSISVEPSAATRPKSRVSANWDFEVTAVSAGRRRFVVTGLPDGWAVKQVLAQGRDVTDTGLEVPAAEDVAGLEIVVTDRLTEVTGDVTDRRDHPAPFCSVLAFAEDPDRWRTPRSIGAAKADENGRFGLRGLPRGPYLVAAVEYLEEGDWNDPDYLESLRSSATKITLTEGQRASVSLRLARRQ